MAKEKYPVVLEPTADGFDFVFSDGFRFTAEHNWGPIDLLKIKNALIYSYELGAQTDEEKAEKKKETKKLITEKVVKGNIKETN